MMNDNLAAYKVWAPENVPWAAWVKPVLFAGELYGYEAVNVPEIDWVTSADKNTMIILDLPGKIGVETGLALAQIGYRPVPLYNGTNAPKHKTATVDSSGIAFALVEGAKILESLKLPSDAPPAFLLDFNRMTPSSLLPGKFDNRWYIFPQDMPSATFLTGNNISKIIVRTNRIEDDLSHILCRYQKQGIKIYVSYPKNENEILEINISEPSKFKSLWYRFTTMIGLRRNFAGGFGGIIPETSSSSG